MTRAQELPITTLLDSLIAILSRDKNDANALKLADVLFTAREETFGIEAERRK